MKQLLMLLLLVPFLAKAQKPIPSSAPRYFDKVFVKTIASGSGTDSMLVVHDGEIMSRPQPAGGSVPTLASNEFTPTFTTGTNVSAVNLESASYIRVGNIVQFAIDVNVTVITAGGTSSFFYMSLPVTSDFTTSNDARGAGSAQGFDPVDKSNGGVRVTCNSTTNLVQATWYSTGLSYYLSFTGQYTVK